MCVEQCFRTRSGTSSNILITLPDGIVIPAAQAVVEEEIDSPYTQIDDVFEGIF